MLILLLFIPLFLFVKPLKTGFNFFCFVLYGDTLSNDERVRKWTMQWNGGLRERVSEKVKAQEGSRLVSGGGWLEDIPRRTVPLFTLYIYAFVLFA